MFSNVSSLAKVWRRPNGVEALPIGMDHWRIWKHLFAAHVDSVWRISSNSNDIIMRQICKDSNERYIDCNLSIIFRFMSVILYISLCVLELMERNKNESYWCIDSSPIKKLHLFLILECFAVILEWVHGQGVTSASPHSHYLRLLLTPTRRVTIPEWIFLDFRIGR